MTRAVLLRWAVVLAVMLAAALLLRRFVPLTPWWRGFFSGAATLALLEWAAAPQ